MEAFLSDLGFVAGRCKVRHRGEKEEDGEEEGEGVVDLSRLEVIAVLLDEGIGCQAVPGVLAGASVYRQIGPVPPLSPHYPFRNSVR